MMNKTKEQLADMARGMYTALQQPPGTPVQGVPTPPPAYPDPMQQMGYPVQPQMPPQAPMQPVLPDADSWAADPTTAFNMQAQAWAQQNVTPQMRQIFTAQAENAKAIVRQAHSEAWSRWGPEIEAKLREVPVEHQNASIIEQAVQLVQGQHAREIADETVQARAEELIRQREAAGQLGATPGVGPTAPATDVLDLDSEEIPQLVRLKMKQANITPETLDEFLVISGEVKKHGNLHNARKAYIDRLKKGTANVAGVTQ
jgi:hypothetical protein